jgi:lauroyl/myristoyl acyltransferase
MENEFLKKKMELYNSIFNSSEKGKKNMMYSFSLFAANVKCFSNQIYTYSELEKACKNVLYYQNLASLEQYYRSNLLNSNIINTGKIDFEDILKNNKTPIFATFHMGSYRLLNSFLYEKGFKSVLIVRGKVFEEQFENIFNEVKPILKRKKESDIIILDANDRKSIFKIKQLVARGYCLTVYLDGNTGVNDEKGVQTKNHLEIPFLNSNMYIRKGIGQLAYLLKLDIIPVMSYRDVNEKNNIEFLPKILFNAYNNKDYIEKSLLICYKYLENYLVTYPWQWECWMYIHSWINRDANMREKSVKNILNINQYLPFYIGEKEYLTNLETYKILPLKKKSINALQNGELSFFSKTEIKELKNKLVLI